MVGLEENDRIELKLGTSSYTSLKDVRKRLKGMQGSREVRVLVLAQLLPEVAAALKGMDKDLRDHLEAKNLAFVAPALQKDGVRSTTDLAHLEVTASGRRLLEHHPPRVRPSTWR